MIIYNKTIDNYCFVSVVRQTFLQLGFEMTSNFRDTSPLRKEKTREDHESYLGNGDGGSSRERERHRAPLANLHVSSLSLKESVCRLKIRIN